MSKSRPPARPAPVEPVEDSDDDPLPPDEDFALEPGDPSAQSTDPPRPVTGKAPELEPHEAGVPSPEEMAYRRARLDDGEAIARCLRRRHKVLASWSIHRGDFRANVVRRVLEADDFPRAHEPLFPWMHKHSGSELRQQTRLIQKARVEDVSLQEVPDAATLAERELSEEDQRLHDLVVRKTANDSGARALVDVMTAEAVEGLSSEEAASRLEIPAATYRKRKQRFIALMRLARDSRTQTVGGVLGMVLLLVGLSNSRVPAMDVSHDVIPTGVEVDPLPEPRVLDPAPIRLAARARRDEALAACAAKEWTRCLNGLNDAIQLDPSLESDPVVRDGEKRANAGINQKPP